MLHMLMLLGVTFLWAKLSPEVLYGIIQGYSRDELKMIRTHSLRNTVFYFGFEAGLFFIIFYLAKGFIFIVALNEWLLAALWQQWLCFTLLLAINSAPGIPAKVVYWKRWATYMGGAIYLFPDLAQLSLALLIAVSLLTFRKKYCLWSNTIAGLFLLTQPVLPYPIKGLMLISCLITSFGVSSNLVKPLVNNTKQLIVSPKQSLEQYNTLR